MRNVNFAESIDLVENCAHTGSAACLIPLRMVTLGQRSNAARYRAFFGLLHILMLIDFGKRAVTLDA